ncbi:MAG: hypothetical protein WDZ28_04155 [Simkaniaceae bacterium]
MKKMIPCLLLSISLTAFEETSSFEMDPLLKPRQESSISLNNRPLAKVLGKTISLVDVVKKMDLFLHQHYPQAFESKATLHQFYTTNWWHTLEEMVNNILIIEEAAEKEMKVSDGDVREEMEERFGPNIMAKLNNLGLGYEEAKQMIHDEIAVRQMSYFKIHSKALQVVTPQKLKERFAAHLEKNPPQEDWTYQMLSIRGATNEEAHAISKRAKELIASGLQNLQDTREVLATEFQGPKITLSNDISVKDRELSTENRSILSSLASGEISPIIEQKSRRGNEKVTRLFHLKDHSREEALSFNELHPQLKNDLLHETVDQYHVEYIGKLRKKYHFDAEEMKASIPENYKPFIAH